MAKIKVTFDGVEYEIEKSALEAIYATMKTQIVALSEGNVGGGNNGGDSGDGSDMPDVPVTASFSAGLYSTGALQKYMDGDVAGAQAMQTKTWDELIAEKAIYVEDGVAYTIYSWMGDNNMSNDKLVGELVFPVDGSVTQIGDNNFYTWDGQLTDGSDEDTYEHNFNMLNNLTAVGYRPSVSPLVTKSPIGGYPDYATEYEI